MRAAIYARVSTERQERQQTIDSQLSALRGWVSAQGHVLADAHVFRDEGVSGSRLDRPALDALRDAIRDSIVDVVVVFSPDRLARKYAYQVLLMEEFRRAGCEVVFLHHPISDDPNDQLLLQIQGAIVRGREPGYPGPPAQIRTSPIKASGSYQEYLAVSSVSLSLVARGPAPVTRFPGSVPGTCFAGPSSSRSPPFAPPTPPPVARLCSLASSLLWQSQTSRVRASSASTPRLPDADQRYSSAGQTRDLPIPAQRASTRARVSDHAGLGERSR